MNVIHIWAPRWKDKTVLVATWKISQQNTIIIDAKNKDGKLFYPDPFYISGQKAQTFPKQKNGNSDVYVIPMGELDTEKP